MTSKDDKMLIKNIATKKKYGTKRLLAEFRTNTVKSLQRKIDDIGTDNRQLGSGRKRKVISLLNKNIV